MEGLLSGVTSPEVPSINSTNSASGHMWDMLLAGALAANKPLSVGPPPAGAPASRAPPILPSPGTAAEADALLPPLPALSAPAAEVGPAFCGHRGSRAECWLGPMFAVC